MGIRGVAIVELLPDAKSDDNVGDYAARVSLDREVPEPMGIKLQQPFV